MNITRHNYEEYLIDYLEGNIDPETLAALQVFFKENPDVEAEVTLLAQDMPVLMPDTAVVYARKESLKKPETGGKTVFWSLNYPRFYTLSLAAALLLFSFGWFVMKYTLNQQPISPNTQAPAVIANNTQTTNTAIPENPITTPHQTETPPQTQPTAHAGIAQTTAPQTPRKSKTKTASQTSHTYFPTIAAAAPASLPTPATTPAQTLPFAQNQPTYSPKLSAPQTLASLTAQQLPLTNYVTVATPQYLPYPTHPEPNRQTPLQNKLAREVGRRLLAQDKQAKSTTKNGDESSTNVVAKLADALLPEAIAAANPKLANPDITLSVTVNSGTHQFIRDFLNR